jgi:hypothetical protein
MPQPTPTLVPVTVTLPEASTTPTAWASETIQNEPGLTLEEDSQLKPLHPYKLVVEMVDGVVLLKWSGTGSDIIQYYQIERRIADAEDWQPLNTVQAIGDNTERYEFRDTSAQPSTTYLYGVKAVDSYNNQSSRTESETITLP